MRMMERARSLRASGKGMNDHLLDDQMPPE